MARDEQQAADWQTVLEAEWAHLARRRRAVNGWPADQASPREPAAEPADARPCGDAPPGPDAADLVGVCCSGGGIRSSTFNLGLLQALARFGLFRHVDLLSTVSGGGFIGTALTAALARPEGGVPASDFPFPQDPDAPDGPLLRHLRERASYMDGRGARDWLRFTARLLRGVILNVLVVLPIPLLAAAAVAALWGTGHFHLHTQPWVTGIMGGLLALWVLLAPVWLRRATLADRDRRERSFVILTLGWLAVALIEAQPALLAWSHAAMAEHLEWGMGASGVLGLAASRQAARFAALNARVQRVVAALGLAAAGAALPVTVYLFVADRLVYGHQSPGAVWAVAGAAVGLWILLGLLYDANAASLHGLYRDRLTETFLVAGGPDGVQIRDGLRLSQTGGAGAVAPYHLVNAAVNLQASADRRLRGRRADFFTFGRAWSGGAATGWCPTADLERADPALTAAAAMAISGAAASPNMGSYTSPPLVLLMTLLNVRLGVWAPNPGWLRAGRHPGRPGPRALLREMTSRLDADGPLVNLSDGGHLENLGLYPLLQRRCRFLVVGDGEADPQRAFAGLTDAIRYARIDLGVQIDLDVAPLRPDAAGLSRRNWAVGTVRYPARDGAPAMEGHLLYLKLGVTGREGQAVQGYRARHPDFPHQPTSDQFFDEAQFEAYRALGEGLVTELMEDTGRAAGPATARDITGWFRELATWQAEAGGPALREALTQVNDSYYLEIYPEARADLAGHRAVGQQLRALEALLADVPLLSQAARRSPRFQGVINQLEVLAATPTFRRNFRSHLPHLSAATVHFCEAVLGLHLDVLWEPTPAGALAEHGIAAGADGAWFRGTPVLQPAPGEPAPRPERAGPPAVWARVDVVAGQARIAQLRAQPKLETLLLLQRAARALLAELDRVAGGLRPLQATDDGVNPGDDHVAFTGPTFTVPTDATRGLDPDPALALPPFAQVQDDLADALPAHLREAYAQAQRRR